ncbi:hypothetical protein DW732_06395 [Collinsella sp. AM28-11LB]|nr:hypothetical protein DW732_06395 [Collinsella sp. AM28-11LB]
MVRELQLEESKAPVAACGLVTVNIEPRVIAQDRALAIAAARISLSPCDLFSKASGMPRA